MGLGRINHGWWRIVCLFIWGLLVSIPSLFAYENEKSAFEEVPFKPLDTMERVQAEMGIEKHRFFMGPVISEFDYEEPSLMTEEGRLQGAMARYAFRDQQGGMFQAEIQAEWGDLDYDGGFQDGTPLETSTNDYLIEGRILGGIDCLAAERHLVTPFLGVGYRYWNDEIEGRGGYEREISYWYIPLGIQTMSPIASFFTLGLHVEYDLFVEGKVTSHLNHADASLGILYNDQLSGKGWGMKGSIQMRFLFLDRYWILMEPFISYWEMADSEPVRIYYDAAAGQEIIGLEPENNTTHYGLRILMEL
jgi:hypothetical protein